ncbi:MAG: cation transporter [Desulfobacteraceae bacterium]|nr:MAG: cation transporter [Desulfobacteraceae bacterium]
MTHNATTSKTASRPQGAAATQRMRMQAIGLSVAVSILLLALKFLTYRLTNSTAVLSDALESVVNVAASVFAVMSIWMAAKPPDLSHPYGHGKIEYFSAGFEGALISGAAFAIFYHGIQYLLTPRPLPHLEQGLLILGAATVINLLLGIYLVRVGRRTDSLALTADGKHILTDVTSSTAVIIGLLLVYWTGWLRIDGVVACLVGITILITGGQLVIQSFKRLMDASDPDLLERISLLLVRNRRPEWIDIHQLRAWRAGTTIHIDLHLVLPEGILLNQAHREAKILEKMLIEEFRGNAGVLVHMDPCHPSECRVCRQPACQQRTFIPNSRHDWNRERMVRPSAGLSQEEENNR